MKRQERSSSVYLLLRPATKEALDHEDMFKMAIESKLASLGEYEPGEIFPWTRCEPPVAMPGFQKNPSGCLAISDGCLTRPLFQICAKYNKQLQDVCDEYEYLLTIIAINP